MNTRRFRIPAFVAIVIACCVARADDAPFVLKRAKLFGDPFLRHGDDVTTILSMADGKRVITAGRDGTVRIWDLATAREVRRFHHSGCRGIWNAVLLPGGNDVLAACDDGLVTRWNVSTGKVLKQYRHGDTVFRLAVTGDGKRMVSAGDENLCILWDMASAKELMRFAGHKESVYTAAFSTDNTRLLTGSGDSTYRVWDAATGKEIACSSKTAGDIHTFARSPDGEMILVCASKQILMLNGKTQEEMWGVKLVKASNCGAWSPNGGEVALECDEGGIVILDPRTGEQKEHLDVRADKCWAIGFSSGGKELMWANEQVVCRVERKTGRRLYPRPDAPLQNSAVKQVVPLPRTDLLLELTEDPGIVVRNPASGRKTDTWVADVTFEMIGVAHNGSTVVALSDNNKAWIIGAPAGEVARTIELDSPLHVDISADGGSVVIGSREMIEIRRTDSGKLVSSARLPRTRRCSVVFSPDGLRVAALLDNNVVQIHDSKTGRMLSRYESTEQLKHCLFLPEDGRSLLCFGKETVHCLEAAAGRDSAGPDRKTARLIEQLAHDSFEKREKATKALIERGEAIIPTILAVDSDDPEVRTRVARIKEAVLTASEYAKKDNVIKLGLVSGRCFAFAPGRKRWAAVAGSNADTTILYGTCDGAEFKLIETVKSADGPCSIAFGGNDVLYTGNRNGTITVYTLENR